MNANDVRMLGLVSLLAGLMTPGLTAAEEAAPEAKTYPTMGSVLRLDPALDALIPADAQIEKLAGGFEWAEGPVWNVARQSLFFSDVPRNVIFEWKEGLGTRDYLYPSGYTGQSYRGKEPGSNGLTLDSQGRLVICQHGNRQVARLESDGSMTVLARLWKYRRFNSPNDLVYDARGNLYFTDPPYGLARLNDDPAKELLFNGVYLLRADGKLELLNRELTFPNGVALSPDEKTLYVAISDPDHPAIMAYPVNDDGLLGAGACFFDAAPLQAGGKGLPDGLKVDRQGNLFATGPGGVLVISPEGKHLGTIQTGEATANCAFGDDGSMLYMTADMFLCRIRTSTVGSTFGKRGR
ncbi:MAG: SMP-30/gluconolactonase/LRE family protein [Verrucomicrobiales bacterium]|nr:SMP-30/gluconolactonase/LRE family protein [Verrucomicrobiales bacterium]